MNNSANKFSSEHLKDPVLSYTRQNFTILPQELNIEQTLAIVREQGIGEKVIYFYVVDDMQRLVGVVPTRRLLISKLDQKLSELMIRNVISIPHTATIMDACDCFAKNKFFAFPVIDADNRVVGVVDVGLFTDKVFDIAEREQMDDVFEAIGFRVSQVRDASPLRAFKFRFPWLLATITSGTMCAFLSRAYTLTLQKSIVLAFFLTLILGLGESVSIQSMTVTIQALRTAPLSWRWFGGALRRELATAFLLGGGCGLLVGLIVRFGYGLTMPAIVIGTSVLFSIGTASLTGLGVPTLVHALKLDPKIAAGPVTLALADVLTLLFYFSLAKYFL